MKFLDSPKHLGAEQKGYLLNTTFATYNFRLGLLV